MEDIEFQRPEAIKAYQEGRLAEALQYLAEHSKYYQRMFESITSTSRRSGRWRTW